MGKKIYVGNLAYGVSSSDLQQMFEAYGEVQSAQVIMDRDTGRSKGFGFVEMSSDQEAQAAIAALNGKETDGRTLTVNKPDPRKTTAVGEVMAAVAVAAAADAVSGTKCPTYGSVSTRPPRVGDPRPAEDLPCGLDRCMIVSCAAHAVSNRGRSMAPVTST